MECFILMGLMPAIFLGTGLLLLIVVVLLGGFYLIYKRQNELLRLSKEQEVKLNVITERSETISEIAKQTSGIPDIARQFNTPQYLAQFTITLSNARSTVLCLRDIIYVSVEKKALKIHTPKVVYTMEGRLSGVVEGDESLLPYPLFVRVHKSYVVNVLHIIESPANKVFLNLLNKDGLPTKIPLSQNYKEHYVKAFQRRENKHV